MLRFTSLGSGSGGNALLVEAGEGGARTRVLIDCGFSARQCALRLERRGVVPESIDAILVTHEHSDHVAGVAAFSRRHRVPVYCSEGTARAAGLIDAKLDLQTMVSGSREAIGAIELDPFEVPHDAAEPLQFVLSDGARRLGVVTDLGHPTALVEEALAQLDGLVLECNHDPGLLAAGPYPAFLKARVAGDRGHLSNPQAAGLLARLDRRRLR
ncbi:MAG: MBL fold metallo-hydrolase, partial [Burkholderiaceae bacterium]